MELGIDKVRINPGNIGDEARIKQVVDMAKEKQIPIRIGVNSGSLEKELVEKYGGVTPQGLVESALKHVHILEKFGFYDIVVSIKASDVPFSIEAYRLLSEAIPYPIHVGITEAGTPYAGTIKSAVGIGTILAMGIGDTIRVSLTGDPIEEIRAAKEILKSLGLRQFGITFVSCPTCGRTEIDLISIANEVEEKCRSIQKNITGGSATVCSVRRPSAPGFFCAGRSSGVEAAAETEAGAAALAGGAVSAPQPASSAASRTAGIQRNALCFMVVLLCSQ